MNKEESVDQSECCAWCGKKRTESKDDDRKHKVCNELWDGLRETNYTYEEKIKLLGSNISPKYEVEIDCECGKTYKIPCINYKDEKLFESEKKKRPNHIIQSSMSMDERHGFTEHGIELHKYHKGRIVKKKV